MWAERRRRGGRAAPLPMQSAAESGPFFAATRVRSGEGDPKASEVMPFDEQIAEIAGWLAAQIMIGAIAGWLAGQIRTGAGFGLVGNIIVGIIGAIIAGWFFPYLWVPFGNAFVAKVIYALIGSIILLFVVGLLKRA